MTGTLHLLREIADLERVAAMVRDEDQRGREPLVVCLQDTVLWGCRHAARPPFPARVVVAADDCRRRGLEPPAWLAVEYAAMVELIVAHPRVICW